MAEKNINDFQQLIENILEIDKKEIQAIDIKQSATGVPYWEIDMYSLVSESDILMNSIICVDFKLREKLINQKIDFKPNNTKLSNFNRYKDPTIGMNLSKSAKGFYSCSIKCYSLPNNEMEMIDKICTLQKSILSIVNKIY